MIKPLRDRGFTFKADDSEEGNLETAIKWRMAKSIAESTSIPVTVSGGVHPMVNYGRKYERNY